MTKKDLDIKKFLDEKVKQYNQKSFIAKDPIAIPHKYLLKQDVEIAGFIAATFAWGNRTTILNKATDFFNRMDNAPHDFIKNHTEKDLQKFKKFSHRTFNEIDALYFIKFLNHHYLKSNTLEDAFNLSPTKSIENLLDAFKRYFFSLPNYPTRTLKHVASPSKNATCKRLNMFLRWMVRVDKKGVDFGIWETINPKDLVFPIDVHVARIAVELGILSKQSPTWQTALSLTNYFKKFDANDPVKYDFALFGWA